MNRREIQVLLNRIILYIPIIFSASLLTGQESLPAKLNFTTVQDSYDAYVGEAVIREAYSRLGIEITVERVPGNEALSRANQGLSDGEVQRIDGINQQYQNLIQVGIPINYLQGAVYSKGLDIELDWWYSLRGYKVGIVRGIVFAEKGTQGLNVVRTETYQSLINLLLTDQVDLIISPVINYTYELKNTTEFESVTQNGVLETSLLYHYLYKDYDYLVPMVEKQLKTMLLDGTIVTIRNETITNLLRGE